MLYTNIMNFSIHIDEETAVRLEKLARETGKKRNALIREAINRLLQTETRKKWPKAVLELAGSAKDLVPFESFRKELPPLDEDPL